MCPIMAGAGNRLLRWLITAGGLTARADIGFTARPAGIGIRIIPGVGRRSITAAGSGIIAGVGAGRRIPFGDRPG